MFQRTLLTASRRLAVAPRIAARRTFVASAVRANAQIKSEDPKGLKTFSGTVTLPYYTNRAPSQKLIMG